MMVCMSHGAMSRASGGSVAVGRFQRGARGWTARPGTVGGIAAQHDRRRERRAVDVGQPAQEIGVRHDQPRIGIRHDMRQQAAAIGEIDRHVDRAEIVEAEPDADRIRPVGQPRQHLVALRDAECRESDRGTARDRLRLAVGPFGAVGETREHLVGRCSRRDDRATAAARKDRRRVRADRTRVSTLRTFSVHARRIVVSAFEAY